MTQPRVSVVVVSRHRPDDLRRCLTALRFQRDVTFEVIVVADKTGLAAINTPEFQSVVKTHPFEQANISSARNLGIGLAAGDLVAFIDDDAIAEPTWLSRLIAPFSDEKVAASGGFVRGRNGFSLQWGAARVDAQGDETPFALEKTQIFDPDTGDAVKTPGTNCAFRNDALRANGGFDEAFRFYLDETDVNMRLWKSGHSTALVPDAQVQHGFSASAFRGSDRAPKSLEQISRSKAYFIGKHGGDPAALGPFRARQRARLMRHLVRGGLEPRDVRRLLAEVEIGLQSGTSQEAVPVPNFPTKPMNFLTFPTHDPQDSTLSGRWINRTSVFEEAASLSARGHTVTAFIFSPTTLFHRRWFHSTGFWVQSGGKYGKSHRDDALFTRYSMAERTGRELADLKLVRHSTLK